MLIVLILTIEEFKFESRTKVILLFYVTKTNLPTKFYAINNSVS